MQINIKAGRRAGKTTLLIDYVLNALDGKNNAMVMLCAKNRSSVMDLSDKLVDAALKRDGYLKEPIKDTERIVTLNGNRIYKLGLYGDTDPRGFDPDIIAIDDKDHINEMKMAPVVICYNPKKTLLITTESE